jgi:small-conductance mechanosensitive channel
VIVEGEWGNVEEITATYVVVRIWDKRRLVVPLNYFIEKPFQNWTRRDAELLGGAVMLYLDHEVSIP